MEAKQAKKNPPLYIKIREFIKRQIDDGIYKEGDMIPTENEFMDKFQVSRGTIKNALKELVEEGVLYRIAGKGTFITSNAAQFYERVDSGKVRKIGFVIDDLRTNGMHLLKGIESSCRELGFLPMIKIVPNQSDEQAAVKALIAAEVEGIIIYPAEGQVYSNEILQLKMNHFPIVLVDRYLPGVQINAVYSDNFSGGFLGTEYLIHLGHRSIGIISAEKTNTSSTEDRFQGYLDAAKKHQLQVGPNHWFTRINSFTYGVQEVRQEYICEWLKREPHMTAVFALSCDLAKEVAVAARSMGKQIPDDLAILSFDNPGIVCTDLTTPYFTWVEQDYEEMGHQAVQLLQKAIHDPSVCDQMILPVTLHEGFSTQSKVQSLKGKG